MKLFKVFSMGLVMLVAGCGGAPPPTAAGAVEQKQGAAMPIGSTYITGQSAVASQIYSCDGWSYRMIFSMAQYPEAASPTGWYADIGPNNPDISGVMTIPSWTNNMDVSAEVYLQCNGGVLPEQFVGTFPNDGQAYNGIYADYRQNPVPCTITTIWPASWHASNPVMRVSLLQYDWEADQSQNGHIYVDIDYPGGHANPGSGWCGRRWFGSQIVGIPKFTRAKPAGYIGPWPPTAQCTGNEGYDLYMWGGYCLQPPPPCTQPGNDPCPPHNNQ